MKTTSLEERATNLDLLHKNLRACLKDLLEETKMTQKELRLYIEKHEEDGKTSHPASPAKETKKRQRKKKQEENTLPSPKEEEEEEKPKAPPKPKKLAENCVGRLWLSPPVPCPKEGDQTRHDIAYPNKGDEKQEFCHACYNKLKTWKRKTNPKRPKE